MTIFRRFRNRRQALALAEAIALRIVAANGKCPVVFAQELLRLTRGEKSLSARHKSIAS